MTTNNSIITVGQLNICGLSTQSTIALQKFLYDQDIKIMALQEVGSTPVPPHTFNNKQAFVINSVKVVNTTKGVALLIDNSLCPQPP